MISKLKAMVVNLIKRAVTTLPVEDDANFQGVQVRYMGKTAVIENILPYGISSSPPVGSLAVMFNVMAQEENRAGIINDPQKRFRGLQEGEVAVGNYLTGSVIKFRQNGDIEISSSGGVNITGDTTITGAFDVTGNTTFTGTVFANGKDIGSAHLHSGVVTGGDPSGPPI